MSVVAHMHACLTCVLHPTRYGIPSRYPYQYLYQREVKHMHAGAVSRLGSSIPLGPTI